MKWRFTVLGLLFLMGLGFQLWVPLEANVSQVLVPPSSEHWWGTDSLGRDLWIRSFQGFSYSLMLALGASVISGALGISLGGIAGWMGGRTDLFVMRVIEILESLPDLLLAVVMSLLLSLWWGTDSAVGSFLGLSCALGLSSWFGIARQTRVLTLRERQMLYADAAVALGASRSRILLRHIWPNIQTSILIIMLLQIPGFILFEATLSFFGFGLQPPAPSLGQILVEGWRVMSATSHVIWGPVFLLFVTLLIFRTLFTPEMRAALSRQKRIPKSAPQTK